MIARTSVLRTNTVSVFRRAVRHGVDDERGTFLGGLVLLIGVVAFLNLLILGGRIGATTADLKAAARDSARDASNSQTLDAAGGQIAVKYELEDRDIECVKFWAKIGDDTNFVPGGWVEVEVYCQIDMSDLTLIPAPGTVTLSSSHVEPIDFYRSVGGSDST